MTQAQKGRVIYLNPQMQHTHRLQEDEEERVRTQINAMPGLECMENVLRDQLHGAARMAIHNITQMMEKNYCCKYDVAILPQTARRLIHTRACLFYVRHCAELIMRLKKEAFGGK